MELFRAGGSLRHGHYRSDNPKVDLGKGHPRRGRRALKQRKVPVPVRLDVQV